MAEIVNVDSIRESFVSNGLKFIIRTRCMEDNTLHSRLKGIRTEKVIMENQPFSNHL